MDIPAFTKQVVRFLFQRPLMRQIWKWVALAVAATVLVWSLMRYAGFLLPEVIGSTPRPWVITWGIAAFIVSLVFKWVRQGRQALKEHLSKYLFEGLLPAAVVVFLVFLFNLLYTVPHRIWQDASTIQPPGPLVQFRIPSSNSCTLDPASCRKEPTRSPHRVIPPQLSPSSPAPTSSQITCQQAIEVCSTSDLIQRAFIMQQKL